MGRRSKWIISQVREESDSELVAKLSDDTILEYLTRAQDRLVSVLCQVDETFFSKEDFIDLVNGTSAYTLPTDMFIKNRLISVEMKSDWSRFSQTDYAPLRQITPREQSGISGYYVQQGGLKISPTPTQSITDGLRLNYVAKPYRMDKRRGKISALAANQITIIEPETGAGLPASLPDDFISIVQKDGTFVIGDVWNDGYNSGTGVITTSTDVTAVAAIGDYVALGARSTVHSDLPDTCERYLIESGKLMVFHKDSSDDRVFQSGILKEIEGELIELFASNNRDAEFVQVSHTEYMDY